MKQPDFVKQGRAWGIRELATIREECKKLIKKRRKILTGRRGRPAGGRVGPVAQIRHKRHTHSMEVT